jgi:hypothetical protein
LWLAWQQAIKCHSSLFPVGLEAKYFSGWVATGTAILELHSLSRALAANE